MSKNAAIHMDDAPYTAHPVAELFPLLDPKSDRYRSLRTSIERNGLWTPIVLDAEGRILDGRNRLQVCRDIGIEPKFVHFADLVLGVNEDGEPVEEDEFAFDQNFARRDLTDDQRVSIYSQWDVYVAKATAGAPVGNTNAQKKQCDENVTLFSKPATRTRKKLATKADVSEHKAAQAIKVTSAAPELAKKVASGELSLKDAAKQVDEKRALEEAGELALLSPQQPIPEKVRMKHSFAIDHEPQIMEAVTIVERIGKRLSPAKRAQFYRLVADRLGDLE